MEKYISPGESDTGIEKNAVSGNRADAKNTVSGNGSDAKNIVSGNGTDAKVPEYQPVMPFRTQKHVSPRIMVADAQGGGIGRQLVSGIRKALPDAYIAAVGTNSTAAANMLKAGADIAASGENAVRVNSRKCDIIAAPAGMVIADSMNGEVTPAMAVHIAQSNAVRILIPFSQCDNCFVGVGEKNTARLVQCAIKEVIRLCTPDNVP